MTTVYSHFWLVHSRSHGLLHSNILSSSAVELYMDLVTCAIYNSTALHVSDVHAHVTQPSLNCKQRLLHSTLTLLCISLFRSIIYGFGRLKHQFICFQACRISPGAQRDLINCLSAKGLMVDSDWKFCLVFRNVSLKCVNPCNFSQYAITYTKVVENN